MLVACAVGAGASQARAEPASVDLLAFHGPASPSPAASAVRDRLQARARTEGLAWIDLSPAPAPASTAPARLRAGIDAYDELRWDDAHAALDDAAAEVWRTGGEALSTTALADVFLYRGLVETQLGDATRAWDDLLRAATLAPTRTLDPMRFPPRAVEAFDRARTAVAALPRAVLTLDAAGCTTTIDGGAAATAALPHGEHAVRVACPGQDAWGSRIVLAADQTVRPPAATALVPPDEAALGAMARTRGAASLLLAAVADGAAGSTVILRVVDASGRAGRRASVALADGDGDGAAALDAALDRLLATEVATLLPVTAPTRWWQSRWLWAAAGAALGAAVILPFAVGGDDPGGATVTLHPEFPW